MTTEIHDTESERDQRYQDLVEKLYLEYTNPKNITMATIMEAAEWGYDNETTDMKEISENVMGDDHYVGSCLVSLVKDYLKAQARKDAAKEMEDD